MKRRIPKGPLFKDSLLTHGKCPPLVRPAADLHPEGELRHQQKQMTKLGQLLGEGRPIELAAGQMGISVEDAYAMVKSDPQLQMRIFQLRGHPIALEEITPKEQLAQIKRESLPSIYTLSMIRDNPTAPMPVRARAAEVLLKMNPDLEVSKKIEAEVVHHHILELQQVEGLQAIMNEIAPAAIEAEFTEEETADEQAEEEH